MKRLFLTLCLITALLAMLTAEAEISSSVPEGQNLYQNTLDSLLALTAVPNADLYYNIGVCHYHTGSTGKAALYFMRALNLDSAHKLARENLKFIQSQLDAEHQAPPQLFLLSIFNQAENFLSLNRLALIILILLLLSALCLHWLLHYPPDREKGLPILLLSICLFFTLGFSLALIIKYSRFLLNNKAVVTAPSASCYADPQADKPMFTIPEAYIITVVSSEGGISRVKLPDGSGVWIKETEFERVIPRNNHKERR